MIDLLAILTYAGIDWLFWGWVVITILMVLDLFIPDPIPFIDEAILIILFLLGGIALTIRSFVLGFGNLVSAASHPLILAFVLTLGVLAIWNKFLRKDGKKKKR
jgi:hypothetical protein